MSFWLLRRVYNSNSSFLNKYGEHLPKNISKQFCQLQTCTSGSRVFLKLNRKDVTGKESYNYQTVHKLTTSLSLLARARGKSSQPIVSSRTSPEFEEESPNTTVQSLLENSSDPSVPPVLSQQQDKKQVLWDEGPYPTNSNYDQSQSKYSYRPGIDPKETSIVLFPGQGTQYVGMGSELLDYPYVQDMYDAASEILGFNLLKACLEGPADHLMRTQVQQPAILVSSLAAVEKLRHDQPSALENCVGTAGFSVGEITALTFAGALSFEDAVQLVKVRAEAMQLASEQLPGGMVTVFYSAASRLGLSCETAKEYCKKRGVVGAECRVASFIGPSCKVVAGSEEALQFLQDHKADFALQRLRRLNVSGAFHTSHMEPAAEVVQQALKHMDLQAPSIPVHSNLDGKPYRNPVEIRKRLPRQMCSPVKWEQTMHVLYEREKGVAYPRTYECGPGTSLKTILAMNNVKAMQATICVKA